MATGRAAQSVSLDRHNLRWLKVFAAVKNTSVEAALNFAVSDWIESIGCVYLEEAAAKPERRTTSRLTDPHGGLVLIKGGKAHAAD